MQSERWGGVLVWAIAFGTIGSAGACSYAADALFGAAGLGSDAGVPLTCENKQPDPGETDVDCGGGGCGPCAAGKHCDDPKNCSSQVCAGDGPTGATCQTPSTNDGVKNGSETGVDCGGSVSAPKCPTGQGCRDATDCIDAVCKNSSCTTPGATDGVKNGSETDVDCGGAQAPKCDNGKGCASNVDCSSGACSQALAVCAPKTAVDGVKNGSETDVDCGGAEPGVPRCGSGKACVVLGDCASSVCTSAVCQPPTGNDGVKNGDETDTDCGGEQTGAVRCAPGQACLANADCQMGCGYKSTCVDSRSCTREHGGDTCGPGEGPEQHESCCALGDAFSGVMLDKYLVTAGRMRAFVEAVDGDMQTWATQHPTPGFDPAWIAKLPPNKFEAEQGLGPYGASARPGCSFADTYRTSARVYDTDSDILGSDGQVDRAVEIPRDLLDEKPLNCVTFEMAAALCAYDGRQIASAAILNAAIAGPDGRTNPWGNAPAFATDKATAAANTAGGYSSYLNAGVNGTFTYVMPANAFTENSRGIPAPGRMANSRGPYGNYDLYAPYLHWVAPGTMLYTYSWEGHGRDPAPTAYGNEAYHAIGFRCMKVL